MKLQSLRTSIAATAALALLAAACGNDSNDAAPDETSETPEADEAPEVEDTEPNIDVDRETLQAILDEWHDEVDLDVIEDGRQQPLGATVSLRVPGHDDIHLASGIDGRNPDTPMPTDGTYRIDRVTRTFVAAIALELVDEGRLSLDDTVDLWLPEVSDADEITVGMLLDHTSGLGDWNESPTYMSELLDDLDRSYTPEEALAKHLEQPRTGRPGEGFAFSRGDSVALGLLIERELEEPLATVLADRITGPLSLDDTRLGDSSGPRETRHGWLSLDGGAPDLDALDFSAPAAATSGWASSGMLSSSADLLDWTEALYSGDFLGAETTAAMVQMRSSWSESPVVHYGLGATGYCLDLNGCQPDDVELVGQAGNYAGSAVRIAYHADSGTTIVVHTNVSPMDSAPFVELAGALLGGLGVA